MDYFKKFAKGAAEQDGVDLIEMKLSDDEKNAIISNADEWEIVELASGKKIYKWQADRIQQNIDSINATRAEIRKEFNIPPPPPWGMGRANYNSFEDLPYSVDNLNPRDWNEFVKTLEKNALKTSRDYAESYKSNLLKAIRNELKGTKGSGILYRTIKDIDAKEIVKRYIEGDSIVNFDFIYSIEDAQNITNIMLSTVAPDRIKKRKKQ